MREIPSVDHSEFVDNSVCMTPMGQTNRITRAFKVHQPAIEFAGIEMDPFNEMQVLEIVGASAFEMTVGKEFFTRFARWRDVEKQR